MKYFLFIYFVTTFLGCTKDSVASLDNSVNLVKLNDTSDVRVGQTVRLATGELVFRFDSLIQEGRCPLRVRCTWQGHASIHLTFPDRVDTLDTYYKQLIADGNYKIIIIDLLPYPIWQQPVEKNSYIAKLKVTL
jgi:hypothetical protein